MNSDDDIAYWLKNLDQLEAMIGLVKKLSKDSCSVNILTKSDLGLSEMNNKPNRESELFIRIPGKGIAIQRTGAGLAQ
jgi:hypothetical protein